MRNQFFYTIINEDPKDLRVIRGSFNVEKIVRSAEYEPDKMVVLLDDFHVETKNSFAPNSKGKIIPTKITETTSSQIFLNEADTLRFIEMTQVA